MKQFLFLALICTMSTSFAQEINRGGWTHPADSTNIYLAHNDTAYVWVKAQDLVNYRFDTGYVRIDTSTTTTRPARIKGITMGENFFNGNFYVGIYITTTTLVTPEKDSLEISYSPFDNNAVVFTNDVRYFKVTDGSSTTTQIWNFTSATTPTTYTDGNAYGFSSSGESVPACGYRFRFIKKSTATHAKVAFKIWIN